MSWNGEERRKFPRAEVRCVVTGVEIIQPAPARPGNEEVEVYLEHLVGCVTCCRYTADPLAWGPGHDGAKACESGSIASGGDRAHCSCDVCY